MNRFAFLVVAAVGCACRQPAAFAVPAAASHGETPPSRQVTARPHEERNLEGRTMWVNPALLEGEERPFTDQALALLAKQLTEIRRVGPARTPGR